MDGEKSAVGVRAPVQERSRRTLDRIEAAALDLIAERGVAGTSVHDIVERAGSSVGSFYARFDGKADLVRYLEDRVWRAARERWDEGFAGEAWAEASLPELVDGLVDLVLRMEGAEGDRRRALGGRRDAGGDRSAGAEAFRRHIARDVRLLVLRHVDALGHPDPEAAAAVVLPVLAGAARELRDVEPHEARRELSRMILAYLGSDADLPEPGPGSPRVDFFDVWG